MTDSHAEEFDWHAAEADATENASIELQTITPDMMLRRILWDMAPCDIAEETASVLGLEVASDDVSKMEHQESHQRRNAALSLIPLLLDWSVYTSQVAVASTIVRYADGHPEKVPQEEIEKTVATLQPVVLEAMITAVSELLDIGFVHLPHWSPEIRVEEDSSE